MKTRLFQPNAPSPQMAPQGSNYGRLYEGECRARVDRVYRAYIERDEKQELSEVQIRSGVHYIVRFCERDSKSRDRPRGSLGKATRSKVKIMARHPRRRGGADPGMCWIDQTALLTVSCNSHVLLVPLCMVDP